MTQNRRGGVLRRVFVATWRSALLRKLVPLRVARRLDRLIFGRLGTPARTPIVFPDGPPLLDREAFIERPDRLLVSVNPNLTGRSGHFFALDHALRLHAADRSIAFASLAGQRIAGDLIDEHPWLVPTFDVDFVEQHVGDAAACDDLRSFPTAMAQGLARVRGTVDAPVSTFWYQANLEYLPLPRLFSDPDLEHHLHLFFAYRYDLDDARQCDHVRRLLDLAASLPNVHLYLGTSELAEAWREHVGISVPVLPSAPSLLPWPSPGPERTASTILLPGTSSRGKGYEDTLELVRRVMDGTPGTSDWTLLIRDESARLDRSERRLLDGARTHPRIRLLQGVVDGEELAHLYARAAAVVLPYRPEPFARRSSGSLTDALASGSPIVAAEGTIAGSVVERFGLGTTYEAGNVVSLVRAIDGAVAHRETGAATDERVRLVEANSIGCLLDRLDHRIPQERCNYETPGST